jgi:hypothetical protein
MGLVSNTIPVYAEDMLGRKGKRHGKAKDNEFAIKCVENDGKTPKRNGQITHVAKGVVVRSKVRVAENGFWGGFITRWSHS